MANQTMTSVLSSSQEILATATIVETIAQPATITVQTLPIPPLTPIDPSTCTTSTSQYSSISSPTPPDTSVSEQDKDPKQPKDPETLSSDAKIGIAIAATFVACALLCLSILFFIKHRKKWAKQSSRQISASDPPAGSNFPDLPRTPFQNQPEENSDAIPYSNKVMECGACRLHRLGSTTTGDSSTVCMYELPGTEPPPSRELMTEANRHELTTSVPNVYENEAEAWI